MANEEIEIKLDLESEDNYKKLIQHLGECKDEHVQKNIFLDTSDNDINNTGWTLRVRRQNNTVTVTVKGMAEITPDGLTIRPEIEELTNAELLDTVSRGALLIANLPEIILNAIGEITKAKPLGVIVSFGNLRKRYNLDDNRPHLILEVDRTEFPDGAIGYELEVELADRSLAKPAMERLSRLLESLNIPLKPQMESKFTRALKRRLGVI